jgi:TrmH family RNA methyltransferase
MKTIESLQHPLVKHWVRLQSDSRYRKSEKRVLLEGYNAICDVSKRIPIQRLIISKPYPELSAVETIVVSDAILKKISSVEESSGIIAEFEMPAMKPFAKCSHIIVSDAIQDPGNMGTLIRTALAFGWEGLFLLPNSIDPFNDKALRSAKGATFFLPLYSGSWDELKTLCDRNKQQIVISSLDGMASCNATSIALVLGNEGKGVVIPSHIDHTKVQIPMKGDMESLNVAVAGGILMYLLQGK